MDGQVERRVQNMYNLPTYQRRLRHLRSVAVRNLTCKSFHGKDIAKLQVFFTLHIDRKSKEFYTSDIITGSLNPTWQSFDIRRFEDEIDTHTKSLVVRVWVRSSANTDYVKLLMDWNINLTGIVFFAEKLQDDKLKYSSNMMILGMFDKYFTAPEVPLSDDEEAMIVDPTVIRNSYTINSLSRIHTVLRAIRQMQMSVKRVHRLIEDKLLSSQEMSRKLSAREDLQMRITLLRCELMWQTQQLQQEKDIREKLTRVKKEHSATLQGRFADLETSKKNLLEKRKQYFQTRESYIKENAQLLIRRKQLISELTLCIYPISENEKQQLHILGVPLPNSENFQGCDDTMLSTSLGYTCHLVMMMSYILGFPLRYPMEYRGSRSLIMDNVHPKLTDKDRSFPLYSKGREKFQFNYGVFLLNKNISQLRFYCGLGTTELKLTLPNIKTMLELRLGVKFDHGNQLSVADFKEGTSNISNEHAETVSSIASGGRASAPDPVEMAMEAALKSSKPLQSTPSPVDKIGLGKENVPISMNTFSTPTFDEQEDLFKSNEDTFFSKAKSMPFEPDSQENSSNGSIGEQHSNGSIGEQHSNGSIGEQHSNGSIGEQHSNGSIGEQHINGGRGGIPNNYLSGHSPLSDNNGCVAENNIEGERHSQVENSSHSSAIQSCALTSPVGGSNGREKLDSPLAHTPNSICDNSEHSSSSLGFLDGTAVKDSTMGDSGHSFSTDVGLTDGGDENR